MNKEDKLNLFLDGINDCVDYWANLDEQVVKKGMKETGYHKTEAEYRCSGLAFSILVMLDGCSGVNDLHSYKIFDGIHEINKGINLHDLYSMRRK